MADDRQNRIYSWAAKYMPSWRKDARASATEEPSISRSSTITDDNQPPSNPKRWSILSTPPNGLDTTVLDRPSSQQGPPSRASLSSRMSFTSMMSSLSLTRSMTKENSAGSEDSRGRSIFRRRPESASQTLINTENDASSRSQTRTRSQSPFLFRRSRNLDPSPAPQAIPLAHSDGDLSDTSSIHPRLTSYTDDSDAETDAETEDEDETEENFFDTVTERNTERNALVITDVQGIPDVEEPDPLGEGVNVVVPHEPYFPSTLDSRDGSSRNKRNPKRRKSVKHEPLPLHTARPIFARDRCTTTLTQGDPVGKLDGRKGRRYMVASDLGEESRYALEWGIGTVLRDGDDLLVVHILENENKIDPPIPNTADRALKLRCQQERQGFAFILVRQSTSLLQRTKLNVNVICQAWHAKNARHMLLDIADYYEPTMLIVGSRGLGQLSGILLGSTSHYLIQKCSVPVMVARRRLKRPPKKSAHLVKNRTHLSLAEAAAIDRVAAKVDTDVKSMHDQMQRAEEERHQERTTGLQPSLRETHPISEEDEAEDAEDEGDEGPQEIKVV